MRTVLLTGGSGFIGRNLVVGLRRRFNVEAPTHGDLDLLDAGAVVREMRRLRPDAIVHAASVGVLRGSPATDVVATNLRMVRNLRTGAPDARFIQIGSGAEYGRQRPLVDVREDEFGRVVPSDPYGEAKFRIAKELGDHGTCLRVFGCFGPHEDVRTRLISNALARSLVGLPVVLEGPDAAFSYLWVEDLAEIVCAALTGLLPPGAYNAVPPSATTLLAAAELARRVAGNPAPLQVLRPGSGPAYTGSNARLQGALPGLKFTPLDEAIGRLHRWYRDEVGVTELRRRLGLDAAGPNH